jgi:hypothetical protein
MKLSLRLLSRVFGQDLRPNTSPGNLPKLWRSCFRKWMSTSELTMTSDKKKEEAYRFSEMTRGFGGRIHPRNIRSIHSSSQNDDKGSQLQRPQHTSQSSGQQQSSFRPLAPRGRGGKGFEGRYGDQPRKIYCLFCGEDKGHTTRTYQITILKQKEIAEAEAR